MRNLKLRKFILKIFWSIIRKFAPTKISRYTVIHGSGRVVKIREQLQCLQCSKAWNSLTNLSPHMVTHCLQGHEKNLLQLFNAVVGLLHRCSNIKCGDGFTPGLRKWVMQPSLLLPACYMGIPRTSVITQSTSLTCFWLCGVEQPWWLWTHSYSEAKCM